MTELTVAFRNFANAAKKLVCVSIHHYVTSKTRNTQTQNRFVHRYNYMAYLGVLTPLISKGTEDRTATSAFKAFGETLSPILRHPKEISEVFVQNLSIFVAYHTTRCHFPELSDYPSPEPKI